MEVEGEKIRILLIEDNPGDARLIREFLAEGGGASFDLEHVDCLSKGLTRLAQGGVDIVLLDLTLPDSHDLDGLGKILAQTLEVPIVVLSGVSDERVTIKAVRGGAQDYLVKGKIDSNILVRALRYAIERQQLRVALGESEARYRLLADNIADVIWTADSEARITYVSPSIKRVLGYTVEETLKLKISDILTPDSTEQARRLVKWQMKTFARGEQYPPASMTLEHVRKDGSTVWAEVMLSFMQDKKGNVTGIMGATRDITERRKAEETLRQSEQRYRLLAENVNDIIWTRDMNLRTTYVSPSVTQMSGYSVEEVVSMSLEESMTPASLEIVKSAFSKVIAAEEGQRDLSAAIVLEVELIHKDGSIVPVEMNVNLLRDPDGHPTGFLGVTRDITERKKAEGALRQSEERYRELFENANDIIYTHDLKGNFISINRAAELATGYTRDELIGKNIASMLTPESLELAHQMITRKIREGGQTRYELEIVTKDGHKILLEVNTRLIYEEGKPVGTQGIARDITERKKAEEALGVSEEKLRRYLESSPDAIYINDENGTFLYGNLVAERVIGYSKEELIGHSFLELNILPPEYLAKAAQTLELNLAGKPTGPDEFELVRKDGSRVFVEISTYPTTHDNKVEVIGIARDITERKKMEQELRLLSDAVKMSTDSITIADLEGNVVDVNEATLKIQEASSKSDLIGLKSSDFIAPEEQEKALEDLGQVMEKGYITGVEYHIVTRDGKRILVETNASIMKNNSGEAVGVVAVTRDITERKKMEQELRLLSDAVKMSKDGIAISDLEGRIVEANEASLKMHGIDNREDLIGRVALELIAPEDHEMLTEKMAKEMVSGEPTYLEYHSVTKDGRKILVEANVSVMRGRNGEPIGYMAVVRDITERKRMEDALRHSEHNYRILFEGTIDGMFVTDIETVSIVLANQTAAKMCGFDSVENTVGINPLDLVHPDDREQVLGFFMEDALGKGEQEVHEFRAITKDGREIWLSGMGSRIEYGGKPAVLSSIRDITERKRMDEALRQSEQSYRVLLESTHDSIIVVDAETFKITFGNRRASIMFGFDPVLQDGVGANILDFIHPEDREIAIKGFMEDLYRAERRRRYDVRAKTQDGREIWVSALGTRIEFQGRIAVLLSLMDITKDKQMEEEKRKLEEQVQLTGRLAAVGELAAGVAHELNNPITAIKGYAQLLTKKKELDEPLRKDLETIYRESQRAARITQNLLSFARKHEPEKHLISINEVIEKTLELRAHPMKVNNIEVIVELDADLPKTLADFHQMQQVFVNIINNAEQAMTEAHGKGKLVVKTKKMRDMIQISFADDGPGIPEDNIKRIFDPFFTTKEVGKGTGLGLSICYGLIEAHSGRIYARSKLGQGATFVVEIPIITGEQLIAKAALLKSDSRGLTWKKPREQY